MFADTEIVESGNDYSFVVECDTLDDISQDIRVDVYHTGIIIRYIPAEEEISYRLSRNISTKDVQANLNGGVLVVVCKKLEPDENSSYTYSPTTGEVETELTDLLEPSIIPSPVISQSKNNDDDNPLSV